MELKRVSFDFDSTLDREDVQEFTKELINKDFEYFLPGIELNMVNLKSFKDGLSSSIWDCDYSYYDCKPEDIIIEESTDEFKHLTIKLKRHRKYI